MNIELLKSMDDQHALNVMRADFDPLVNTPLEAFLIDWLESLIDEQDDELTEAVAEYDFEPKNIKALGDALIQDTDTTVALLEAIGEAGFDSPELLKAELELARKFRALTEDAGDVFTRLSQLTTEQE